MSDSDTATSVTRMPTIAEFKRMLNSLPEHEEIKSITMRGPLGWILIHTINKDAEEECVHTFVQDQ